MGLKRPSLRLPKQWYPSTPSMASGAISSNGLESVPLVLLLHVLAAVARGQLRLMPNLDITDTTDITDTLLDITDTRISILLLLNLVMKMISLATALSV